MTEQDDLLLAREKEKGSGILQGISGMLPYLGIAVILVAVVLLLFHGPITQAANNTRGISSSGHEAQANATYEYLSSHRQSSIASLFAYENASLSNSSDVYVNYSITNFKPAYQGQLNRIVTIERLNGNTKIVVYMEDYNLTFVNINNTEYMCTNYALLFNAPNTTSNNYTEACTRIRNFNQVMPVYMPVAIRGLGLVNVLVFRSRYNITRVANSSYAGANCVSANGTYAYEVVANASALPFNGLPRNFLRYAVSGTFGQCLYGNTGLPLEMQYNGTAQSIFELNSSTNSTLEQQLGVNASEWPQYYQQEILPDIETVGYAYNVTGSFLPDSAFDSKPITLPGRVVTNSSANITAPGFFAYLSGVN